MGAAEISGLAKAFNDYGIYFVAIVLGAACIALYREVRSLERARLEDANKHHAELSALAKIGIENDKDQVHVTQASNDLIRAQDEKLRRIEDYIRSRPNV